MKAGKFLLQLFVGGALILSLIAVYLMLARNMNGHAVIAGVMAVYLYREWGQI